MIKIGKTGKSHVGPRIAVLALISLLIDYAVFTDEIKTFETIQTSAHAASLEPTMNFPLRIPPGQRHLEDSDGNPFLIKGDAAWSLIADLTREEVDLYLEHRRAKGFNTILASLIEHRFATNAPANAYDQQPFQGQPFETLADLTRWVPVEALRPYVTGLLTRFLADFSRPNETYFAHADWVLRRAAEEGFLVLLAPAYVGYQGGTHGWYQAMVANGEDLMQAYGEFLGRRYRDFDNIVWVHGGDYDPPAKGLVRAIAKGIAAHDPDALHTAHGAPETAAIDYWRDEPWLDVNSVYTYQPVHIAALRHYLQSGPMPFFLIESSYENERDSTARSLRAQAYQAMLSGAAGQVFGNSPMWHFNGPGLYPTSKEWRRALQSDGALSMTRLSDLFRALPWWQLKPDVDKEFLTDGLGPVTDRSLAAVAADRSTALVYLPTSRTVTVDLTRLDGSTVEVRWYDPASGRFSRAEGSPFSTKGLRDFKPKSENDSGSDDWILVFETS